MRIKPLAPVSGPSGNLADLDGLLRDLFTIAQAQTQIIKENALARIAMDQETTKRFSALVDYGLKLKDRETELEPDDMTAVELRELADKLHAKAREKEGR